MRNPAGSLADPNLVEWYSKWFKARDLYTSERSNRFIRRTLERLYRNRYNPKYYCIITTVLIKRSTAFRMAHINKVFPHWYYNGESWLLKINNKFLNLVKKWDTRLQSKRVWIPKPTGSDPMVATRLRPLWVPAPEWRLLTSMWSQLILLFFSPLYPPPSPHSCQCVLAHTLAGPGGVGGLGV